MYDAILCPTDGSDGAGRALEYATDLAAAHNAELHILYVVDSAVAAVAPSAQAASIRDVLEVAGRTVIDNAEIQAIARDVPVVTAVKNGNVHQTIIEYADAEDVDLVVMGTHGRSGIDRVLLGSNTERVIKRSDRPVLVISSNPDSQ